MSSVVDRRARIHRVRKVQHLQASLIAGEAQARVVDLESSATRIATLRGGLTGAPGLTSGAALGGARELMARLQAAEASLAHSIAGARAVAETRAAERMEARRNQDGAEKLEARAARQLQDELEARVAAAFRPRFKGRPE